MLEWKLRPELCFAVLKQRIWFPQALIAGGVNPFYVARFSASSVPPSFAYLIRALGSIHTGSAGTLL